MGLAMDPYIMTWLHNYLANRRQTVVVNGTTYGSSHAIFRSPLGVNFGSSLVSHPH